MKKILNAIFLTTLSLLLALVLTNLSRLSKSTHTNLFYFPTLFFSVLKNKPQFNELNIAFLGLDYRDDKFEKTETTDTIVIFNLNQSSTINTISLPRDLWDYSLKTKINKIYPQSKSATNQFAFIQNHFSNITGLTIDKTIILNTENLSALVDTIGGVDVFLDKGFKDDMFPNPEYIKNPSPKTPVYITVVFPAGNTHLTSENINYFIRSRKSAQDSASGGTDIGRTKRQQLVINALLDKIKSPSFLKNPNNLISLYNFFHQKIETNLTDTDILNILLAKNKTLLNTKLNKITIPTNEDAVGIKDYVLYYPGYLVEGQWVFLPLDKEYKGLQQFIKQALSYE